MERAEPTAPPGCGYTLLTFCKFVQILGLLVGGFYSIFIDRLNHAPKLQSPALHQANGVYGTCEHAVTPRSAERLLCQFCLCRSSDAFGNLPAQGSRGI